MGGPDGANSRGPGRDWPRLLECWGGPLAIAAAALAMLAWTGGTWPDVLVDFGQQLYLAWQVSEGKALYRDLAYYNGPLSIYVNGAIFAVFGVGLRTLVVANLAVLTLLVILLFRVCEEVGNRLSATAACLTFVLGFAFAQFQGIGNFNYVCPYTHELTHGVLLCLAALAAVWRAGRGPGWVALGGIALGLAFLTKAEVFQAGAAGVAVVLGLGMPGRGSVAGPPGQAARLGLFVSAAAIPPLVAFLGLWSIMPAEEAFKGVLGSWSGALNPRLVGLPFFRTVSGFDDVAENLSLLLTWSGRYAAVLVPSAALALAARRPGWSRPALACATFAAVAAAVLAHRSDYDWLEAARPWPAGLIVAGAVAFSAYVRGRRSGESTRVVRQLSLIVFSLALMAKILLNARINHYGFVLAMPATLVLVVALFAWVPALIDASGGSGLVFRASGAALLMTILSIYLGIQSEWVRGKTRWVGRGPDAFRADERGAYVSAAMRALQERAGIGETLVAFPEGVILNYLDRRRDPIPYTTFSPTEMVLYDEARILESLRTHPPDLVALVHKDTSETGFHFFGRDYGRRIGLWIAQNYRADVRIGDVPLREDDRFGILLLRRKDSGSKAIPRAVEESRDEAALPGTGPTF